MGQMFLCQSFLTLGVLCHAIVQGQDPGGSARQGTGLETNASKA